MRSLSRAACRNPTLECCSLDVWSIDGRRELAASIGGGSPVLHSQLVDDQTGQKLAVHLDHRLWVIEDAQAACGKPCTWRRQQLPQTLQRRGYSVMIGRTCTEPASLANGGFCGVDGEQPHAAQVIYSALAPDAMQKNAAYFLDVLQGAHLAAIGISPDDGWHRLREDHRALHENELHEV